MDNPNPFSLKTSLIYILANEDVENNNRILTVKEKNKRNTFDRLMFDIHKSFNITDKRGRGLRFAVFCYEWLKFKIKYKNIWLWKDLPDEFRKKMGFKMKVTDKGEIKKKDIGIDIIVEDFNGHYSAIQCKYMNPVSGRPVNYGKLCTFNSLCARSKVPFKEEILMTNVYQYGGKFDNEITMKSNQKVINSTIFRKTPRDLWERMAGYKPGHILGTASDSNKINKEPEGVEIEKEPECIEKELEYDFPGEGIKLNSDVPLNSKIKTKKIIKPKKVKIPGKGEKLSDETEKPKTTQELREERLKIFDRKNSTPIP